MLTRVKTQPALVVEFQGTRRAYPLNSRPLTVGRASDADVCILHGQVSRQQALIRAQGADKFVLLDGDGCGRASRNGTYVNWEPVGRKVLELGDVICFGSPAAVAHFCLLDESDLQRQERLCSVKEQIEIRLMDGMETGAMEASW